MRLLIDDSVAVDFEKTFTKILKGNTRTPGDRNRLSIFYRIRQFFSFAKHSVRTRRAIYVGEARPWMKLTNCIDIMPKIRLFKSVPLIPNLHSKCGS